VPRICFYHLVYSGRGSELIKEDLDHAETRAVVDLIMDRTRALHDKGKPKEVLTVDNHADGPYVYFRMLQGRPQARGRSAGAPEDERGQFHGPRHRLHLLGRLRARGPVHAPPHLRQRS
jgi:hypothetical protein